MEVFIDYLLQNPVDMSITLCQIVSVNKSIYTKIKIFCESQMNTIDLYDVLSYDSYYAKKCRDWFVRAKLVLPYLIENNDVNNVICKIILDMYEDTNMRAEVNLISRARGHECIIYLRYLVNKLIHLKGEICDRAVNNRSIITTDATEQCTVCESSIGVGHYSYYAGDDCYVTFLNKCVFGCTIRCSKCSYDNINIQLQDTISEIENIPEGIEEIYDWQYEFNCAKCNHLLLHNVHN